MNSSSRIDSARERVPLTDLERKVLIAIKQNASDASGGSFAVGGELHHYLDIPRRVIPGVVSSLAKKGYIKVDGPVADVDSQIQIIEDCLTEFDWRKGAAAGLLGLTTLTSPITTSGVAAEPAGVQQVKEFDDSLIELPSWEKSRIRDAADKHDLKGDARTLLYVIRRIENGGPGREFGIMLPDADTFEKQASYAANTIKKRFTGDLRAFAHRYSPADAEHWIKMAKSYMDKWTENPTVPLGPEQLSAHFKRSELADRKTGELKVHPMLVFKLEALRAKLGGTPIQITSGYRTPEHNAEVGGKPKSQHMHGRAADIKVKGYTPAQVAKFAKEVGFTYTQVYPTWTHVDVRGL